MQKLMINADKNDDSIEAAVSLIVKKKLPDRPILRSAFVRIRPGVIDLSC
jgi:hypothetical protein